MNDGITTIVAGMVFPLRLDGCLRMKRFMKLDWLNFFIIALFSDESVCSQLSHAAVTVVISMIVTMISVMIGITYSDQTVEALGLVYGKRAKHFGVQSLD